MGPMARAADSIDVGAVRPEASGQNLRRIRQTAPRCLTLSSRTMAANCEQGAKSDVYDWLVATVMGLRVSKS